MVEPRVALRAAKLAGSSAAYLVDELVDELVDSWAAKMVDSKALPFA